MAAANPLSVLDGVQGSKVSCEHRGISDHTLFCALACACRSKFHRNTSSQSPCVTTTSSTFFTSMILLHCTHKHPLSVGCSGWLQEHLLLSSSYMLPTCTGEEAHITRVEDDSLILLEVRAALVLLPAVQVIHRAVSILHGFPHTSPGTLGNTVIEGQGGLLPPGPCVACKDRSTRKTRSVCLSNLRCNVLRTLDEDGIVFTHGQVHYRSCIIPMRSTSANRPRAQRSTWPTRLFIWRSRTLVSCGTCVLFRFVRADQYMSLNRTCTGVKLM